MTEINLREAVPSDAKGIIELIKELAQYEKLSECVKLTEEEWINDGFGEQRFFYTFVAEEVDEESNKKLVGLALFFYTYSTWEGRSALLEDIYIKPAYRRKGVGHMLLENVAKTVLNKGCNRLDLHVLDWNAPSLHFFKQQGAIDLTDKEGWHFLRFTKDKLVDFSPTAGESPSGSQTDTSSTETDTSPQTASPTETENDTSPIETENDSSAVDSQADKSPTGA